MSKTKFSFDLFATALEFLSFIIASCMVTWLWPVIIPRILDNTVVAESISLPESFVLIILVHIIKDAFQLIRGSSK